MKPKIDIYDERYGYGLAWFDEDGEGLRFGDSRQIETASTPPANDPDMAEHWHAYKAALKTPGCLVDHRGVLTWESISQAKVARAAARAAVKLAHADKPMPAWAETALANGWKAPKGWKP
jgi:hypothetical protein